MREPINDDAVIRHFLATSRWYLLQARIATDTAGRVRIDAPGKPPARAPEAARSRSAA